jgi:Xaa-Pro aminopeptidase
MRAAKAGLHEYELQAEIERVFRMHDAEPAYGSIVGAGANACVLHYRPTMPLRRTADLVLIDAGAEYRGYASDITRTFRSTAGSPRNSGALHDLVGAAQAAALAQAKPGAAYEAGHIAAVQVLDRGIALAGAVERQSSTRTSAMAATGVSLHAQDRALDRAGTCTMFGDNRIDGRVAPAGAGDGVHHSSRACTSHRMTRASRQSGAASVSATEDDVLVTNDGHRVLTDGLARSADEIEAFMQR